jgi:hypothetical protein
VHRVDEDDLVELVRRVLRNPVRVEDAEAAALAADALLGERAQVALPLELVNAGVDGLAVVDALRAGDVDVGGASGDGDGETGTSGEMIR